MKEKARKFLESVIEGILNNPFDIIEDVNDSGIVFVVIPKDPNDYHYLIGKEGRNAETLRSLMRIWSSKNAPLPDGHSFEWGNYKRSVFINVLVPNPELIKKEIVS